MTQPGYSMYYASPLGRLKLESDGAALTALSFEGACPSSSVNPGAETVKPLPVFAETCRWLDIYFSGGVPDFIPALNLQGSAFRQAVWKILLEIPYGVTTVGHNPVAIIVPCHRVIGADGSLTGYASGLPRKTWLLHHEGVGDVDAERR